MSLLRTDVNGAGTTPKALDLFGPASFASEDEAAAPAHAPH
jgi:hypothetical protein